MRANLGWKNDTINYDSDFSPNDKYMVHMHGAVVKSKRSYDAGMFTEIYVTRFPPDGVNVRLTWLNSGARHPHWVAANGAK